MAQLDKITALCVSWHSGPPWTDHPHPAQSSDTNLIGTQFPEYPNNLDCYRNPVGICSKTAVRYSANVADLTVI